MLRRGPCKHTHPLPSAPTGEGAGRSRLAASGSLHCFPGTLPLPAYPPSACLAESSLECLQHQQLVPLCHLLSHNTYNLLPMPLWAGQCPLPAVVASRLCRCLSVAFLAMYLAAVTVGYTASLSSRDWCGFCFLMGPDTALMTCPSFLIF